MAPRFRAVVCVADYFAVDAAGKVTGVGVGFTITPLLPMSSTAPMYVAALIDVPPEHLDRDIAISMELRRADGQVVTMPAPAGVEQAMRVDQLDRAMKPSIPNLVVPDEAWGRCQTLLGFPGGLTLAPGRYFWRLSLDHQHLPSWEAHFSVVAPPQIPVIGGPAGPSAIDGVQAPSDEYEEEIEDDRVDPPG